MSDISTQDFLAHYGVKGMKWGVRREKLRVANQDVKSAKAVLRQAKAERRALRKDQARVVAKPALITAAVVVGAAATATALSRGGNRNISNIDRPPKWDFAAYGDGWSVETNSGEAFKIAMDAMAARKK